MKHLLLTAALFVPGIALAQSGPVTPMQKLPPANPLPYEDAEGTEVLEPIHALLASFEAGDAAAMLRQVYPQGRTTGVTPAADGSVSVQHLSWAEYAATIKPSDTFVERIRNPAIEIDGNVAMVWAPYTVHVGGKLTNCGINLFDLIREGRKWKVLNATYMLRTTGCPAQ